MTLDEAYEFFATYGNVHPSVEILKTASPTIEQLHAAARYAENNCHQDKETVYKAFDLIAEHHNLIGENNDA